MGRRLLTQHHRLQGRPSLELMAIFDQDFRSKRRRYSYRIRKRTGCDRKEGQGESIHHLKRYSMLILKMQHRISSLSTIANQVHLQTATTIQSALIPHKMGITFADIRLAYLADASLAEEYAADRAEPPRLRSDQYRPETTLKIERRQWSTVVAKPPHAPSELIPRPLHSVPSSSQNPGPLRDDEMAKYLKPLFTHEWTVNHTFLMGQVDNVVRRWRVTRLLKKFNFKTYEGANIFMRTASEIASKEGVRHSLTPSLTLSIPIRTTT